MIDRIGIGFDDLIDICENEAKKGRKVLESEMENMINNNEKAFDDIINLNLKSVKNDYSKKENQRQDKIPYGVGCEMKEDVLDDSTSVDI